MTYYDWENIVKKKTIIELKKMIEDNLLGKDATNYAIIELLKRYEKEELLDKNNINVQKINFENLVERGNLNEDESEFLKKLLNYKFQNQEELNPDQIKKIEGKITIISYVIGILQIIGGFLLIIGITNLIFKNQIYLKDGLIVSIEICIALLSIIAGILLLSKRKIVILSQINQYLQLIHFKTSVLTFSYFSGAAIFTGFMFKPLTRIVLFNPLGIFSKIELYWSYGFEIEESFIFINILSLIMLFYLSRLKKLMKKINKTPKT